MADTINDVDDIETSIASNATGPIRVNVDGQEVIQRTSEDQIKAVNHVASANAVDEAAVSVGLNDRIIRAVYFRLSRLHGPDRTPWPPPSPTD